MVRKSTGYGFGKGLHNETKRRQEAQQRPLQTEKITTSISGNSRSVLEQSTVDEVIATIDVRKMEWEEAYGEAEEVNDCVLLDLNAPLEEVEASASKSRELVSIPRRPKWSEGMSMEELSTLESDAFLEWRRGLKELETAGGLVMTPYERNLDFWRQLWRCMERSDLLVQVLDARDPDFYFCQDLCQYMSELGGSKRLMLLVNKADYLSKEQRQQWAAHFEAKNVDAIFFSALHEVQKQENAYEGGVSIKLQADSSCPMSQASVDATPDATPSTQAKAMSVFAKEAVSMAEVDAVDVPVPDSSDDELAEGEADVKADAKGEAALKADASEADESEDEGLGPRGLLVEEVNDEGVADVAKLLDALRQRLPKPEEIDSRKGIVGFVGYPNVGKSTVINALVGAKKVGMSRTPGKTKHIQTLELPEWGFSLCDAPGLVFPSVVATRSHLVINNTVPLDDLVTVFAPIRLIIEKIGFAEVLRRYKCTSYIKDAAARSGDHVLDEAHSFLAALSVSRNHFLRAGVPDENWAARKVLRDYCTGKLLHCEPPPGAFVAPASSSGATAEPAPTTEDVNPNAEEDFDGLNELPVDDDASTMGLGKMTKKKERHLLKQLSKGIAPAGFAQESYVPAKRGANARAKALC